MKIEVWAKSSIFLLIVLYEGINFHGTGTNHELLFISFLNTYYIKNNILVIYPLYFLVFTFSNCDMGTSTPICENLVSKRNIEYYDMKPIGRDTMPQVSH